MVQLAFFFSITAVGSMVFGGCALEGRSGNLTIMESNGPASRDPGLLKDAGKPKEENIEKVIQNDTSALPSGMKDSKTEQLLVKPPLNVTQKEMLIKEKVMNTSREIEKNLKKSSTEVVEKPRSEDLHEGEDDTEKKTKQETIIDQDAFKEPSEDKTETKKRPINKFKKETGVELEKTGHEPEKAKLTRNVVKEPRDGKDTVIVVEKKDETSVDGKKKLTEKEVKFEPGKKIEKEVVIEKDRESSDQPMKEKVTEKEIEQGDKETETEIIIEKKGENSAESEGEKITEKEVKKEPGKKVTTEVVIEKKGEIKLKPGKEHVAEREVKKVPGKKVMEEVTIKKQPKVRGTQQEEGDNKVLGAIEKNGVTEATERQNSGKPSGRIITVQKPDKVKRGTTENVTVVRIPKNEKKNVARKKEIEKPDASPESERDKIKQGPKFNEGGSVKVPTNETETLTEKEVEVLREPKKEVKVEKVESATRNEVKERAQKPTRKIEPEHKKSKVTEKKYTKLPAETEHRTDSSYEYDSDYPSRDCYHRHHRQLCSRTHGRRIACRSFAWFAAFL